MKEKKQIRLGAVQWVSCALLLCMWLALGAFHPTLLRQLIAAYEALVQQLPVLEFSRIKRIVSQVAVYFAGAVC
ncbi:MAG: hypothetical protein IKV55_00645 [Oscillospiraceae bacterium]|nr:hypothetical protein [Oscillospiraceae bacterium]